MTPLLPILDRETGRTHMSQKFYQVMISSELRTQGLRLLEHLIRKRLIFGGPVLSGPARFLWKNEIVEHDYCWTITFTPQDLRDELIKEAEKELGAAPPTVQTADEVRTLAEVERDYIAAALRASGGNRAKAAEKLGIGAATLYRKLKQARP